MSDPHVVGVTPSVTVTDDSNLWLRLIFTTNEATRSALTLASRLAKDLDARIELLVPYVVSYPADPRDAVTPAAFAAEKVVALVRACRVAAKVQILLCRDRDEAVPEWVPAGSVVVVGRRRRWGPGSFRRLIQALRRARHHVLVVDSARQPTTSL